MVMKLKTKWWAWVLLGLAALIVIYLFQACSAVKAGFKVTLNDLIGNYFATSDDEYFVSFKDETQSDYFDGSLHQCSYTLKDGNIALTEDEETVYPFVALSGDRLFDNSLNKILYKK